jgi:hypothetical protein
MTAPITTTASPPKSDHRVSARATELQLLGSDQGYVSNAG